MCSGRPMPFSTAFRSLRIRRGFGYFLLGFEKAGLLPVWFNQCCHIVNIRGNSSHMSRHADLSKAIHPGGARDVSSPRPPLKLRLGNGW